ncbi:DUF6053 domain-containing protein [Lysobacter yananisis]
MKERGRRCGVCRAGADSVGPEGPPTTASARA